MELSALGRVAIVRPAKARHKLVCRNEAASIWPKARCRPEADERRFFPIVEIG